MTDLIVQNWGATVSRVAESMNPVSTVSRALVELSASWVELRRLKTTLATTTLITDTRVLQLEARHLEMMAILRGALTYLHQHAITLKSIRGAIALLEGIISNPEAELEFKLAAIEQLPVMSSLLVEADRTEVLALSVFLERAHITRGLLD